MNRTGNKLPVAPAKRSWTRQESLTAKNNPHSSEQKQKSATQDPGRTPGRAEGDEIDVEGMTGPQAVEQERPRDEPKRTPGKAEG